jgi:hypothetical protein
MKFASSATLLLVAALSTLSAAQDVITQASVKPMIVKPGGLVTVTYELVGFDDTRRSLEEAYTFRVGVSSARESTLSIYHLFSHPKVIASSVFSLFS